MIFLPRNVLERDAGQHLVEQVIHGHGAHADNAGEDVEATDQLQDHFEWVDAHLALAGGL